MSDPLCKTDTEPRNERPRFDPDDRNREKVTHEHPHCSHEYLFSSTDPIYAAADGLHHRYANSGSGQEFTRPTIRDVIHPLLCILGLGTRLININHH